MSIAAPASATPPSDADTVALLRRFNRSYTQRIGVLDDSFLGCGRPLGQARLLFEIGPSGSTVLDLRNRLGLDSGYASRLLRQLESEGLVLTRPDPADARRRVAELTEAGQQAWSELDRRSDELAAQLVAPLSDRQRDDLRRALATAERLIFAATVRFDAVDPHDGDARAAMLAYFDELDQRFPEGFDPGDAVGPGADALGPPTGRFVVAHHEGVPVACGGVQRLDDGVAEIKRMWVAPDWRGIGLGRRMLAHLEGVARDLGHRCVRLDTNSTLTEAIAMYESAGYHPIARYNDNPYARHWFEKPLD